MYFGEIRTELLADWGCSLGEPEFVERTCGAGWGGTPTPQHGLHSVCLP